MPQCFAIIIVGSSKAHIVYMPRIDIRTLLLVFTIPNTKMQLMGYIFVISYSVRKIYAIQILKIYIYTYTSKIFFNVIKRLTDYLEKDVNVVDSLHCIINCIVLIINIIPNTIYLGLSLFNILWKSNESLALFGYLICNIFAKYLISLIQDYWKKKINRRKHIFFLNVLGLFTLPFSRFKFWFEEYTRSFQHSTCRF